MKQVAVYAAGHDWNSKGPEPSRALPVFFDRPCLLEAEQAKNPQFDWGWRRNRFRKRHGDTWTMWLQWEYQAVVIAQLGIGRNLNPRKGICEAVVDHHLDALFRGLPQE